MNCVMGVRLGALPSHPVVQEGLEVSQRNWQVPCCCCPHQVVGQGQDSSGASPVTMYWESPEKAQSHIQPRDVSPGLLLLMLSSVIREKLEVLQILQV